MRNECTVFVAPPPTSPPSAVSPFFCPVIILIFLNSVFLFFPLAILIHTFERVRNLAITNGVCRKVEVVVSLKAWLFSASLFNLNWSKGWPGLILSHTSGCSLHLPMTSSFSFSFILFYLSIDIQQFK